MPYLETLLVELQLAPRFTGAKYEGNRCRPDETERALSGMEGEGLGIEERPVEIGKNDSFHLGS